MHDDFRIGREGGRGIHGMRTMVGQRLSRLGGAALRGNGPARPWGLARGSREEGAPVPS